MDFLELDDFFLKISWVAERLCAVERRMMLYGRQKVRLVIPMAGGTGAMQTFFPPAEIARCHAVLCGAVV